MAADTPWPDIDPLDALRALGFPEPLELEPVIGGWDTAMWRFATGDGARHALRVFKTADRLESATRERMALAAAAEAGLPVPAVEAFGEWQGLPAVILSWCPGEPLVSSIERKPWKTWRLSRELGRMHARIHALPIPDALRDGAPHYRQFTAGWEERHLYDSLMEAPAPDAEAFLHGDFHPINVLSDGRTITGIVDWANATAGDRRVDLAWTVTLISVGPAPPSPWKPLYALGRRLFCDGWRRGYESAGGPIPDLTPFLAWAGTAVLREVLPRMDFPPPWAKRGWAHRAHRDAARRWTERWRRRAGIG